MGLILFGIFILITFIFLIGCSPRGIYVHGTTMAGLAEEAGGAYKDVNSVVETLEKAGITKRVVMLKTGWKVEG